MNAGLDTFTYLTGIASLLGLAIQFKDGFAQHRETRKTIVLLVLGVFLGSLIASLAGLKVDFGATLSPMHALVALVVLVIAIVAVAGAFASDPVRREHLFVFTGFGALALFVLLFMAGLSSIGNDGAEREKQLLTIEEFLFLSDSSASRGNYDRALQFLGEARARLPAQDERRQLLLQREVDLKRKQVGGR